MLDHPQTKKSNVVAPTTTNTKIIAFNDVYKTSYTSQTVHLKVIPVFKCSHLLDLILQGEN